MTEQSNGLVLRLVDIANTDICVTSDDGDSVFFEIDNNLCSGRSVQISFEGVMSLTSAFLNTAIGQLYGKYSDAYIRNYLKPVNANSEQLALLKRVVDNAKLYFRSPEAYMQVNKEINGESLDEDD